MAKTIEQMAIEYGHEHMGCCDIEDFEAGANAVLEELEMTISVSEDGWLESNIRKLVKQLKGE